MAPPNQPNGADASALRAAVPHIGAIDTRFAFQHFHRKPRRRQIGGQGTTADAARYDDDIESPPRCVPNRMLLTLRHAPQVLKSAGAAH